MPPAPRGNHPLTHEELLFFLEYVETGGFVWRRSKPRIREGDIAGYLHSSGYRHVTLCGREYKEHRLVWFYHSGTMPADDVQIDHVDRDRSNNRIENLRPVSQGQNMANMSRYGRMRGIMDRGSCFRVRINIDGVRTNASFASLEEAIEYRDRVFVEQWGHGVIES